MNKKAIYSILSVIVAMVVLSVSLVFAIGPRVSAMKVDPIKITLSESDFYIKDSVLLGLRKETAESLNSLYFRGKETRLEVNSINTSRGFNVEIYVIVPEGVTKILGGKINGTPCSFLARWYYDYDYDYDHDRINDDVGYRVDYSQEYLKNYISISLPNSLEEIGDYALDIYGLETITIPANVTEIGERIFGNAFNDQNYVLYEINVEDQTLWENLNLRIYSDAGVLFDQEEYFEFDENGVLIGVSAAGAEYAQQFRRLAIVIPDGVKEIRGHVNTTHNSFHSIFNSSDLNGKLIDDIKIISVSLPDGLTTIGDYAFTNCYKVKSITIPASVTEIGTEIFKWCGALSNINAENPALLENENIKPYLPVAFDRAEYFQIENGVLCGLTQAGWEVAREHEHLNVVIPNGVIAINGTQIEDWWFSSFYYDVGTGKENIEDYSYKIISLTLPDSLTTIGEFAFPGCACENIKIPDHVTSIGRTAFDYAYVLNHIELSNSLEEIGDYAFRDAEELVSITIPASVTTIGEHVFGYIDNNNDWNNWRQWNKLRTIYVESDEMYNHLNLAQYGSIVRYAPERNNNSNENSSDQENINQGNQDNNQTQTESPTDASIEVNNQNNIGLIAGIAGTSAGVMLIVGIVLGIIIGKRRRK